MTNRRWMAHAVQSVVLVHAVLFSAGLVAGGGIVMAQSVPVFQNERYSVWSDHVQQGAVVATATSSTALESTYPMDETGTVDAAGPLRKWSLTADLSGYPRLSSSDRLSEALYNLSLEELRKDTATAGTYDAGAKWPGVWTRDVSYSILLSLAAIEPEAAKATLLRKVRRGRIVQDTGTGGSWPVSTDRLTWGLAAWEIYLVSGDRSWLQQVYPILRDSIGDDLQVVVDPVTGLARGESSFLDWREQTYPRWMQPVDIYQSQALGTNAVFYQASRVLGLMCRELQEPCGQWDKVADRVRASVNDLLWSDSTGLYGQYRYGGVYPAVSPRAEALGEALTILFDLAPPARQTRMLQAQPVMAFGVPTVYPQTPGIPPYHNDSVWPFVQAFWTMAAAKKGDEPAVLQGIAAIDRAAALFLTNKENFVADTGTAAGTQVNSDRQLWSVAGNLAMTYRVLFGMQFHLDGLHFAPVVPKAMEGVRSLRDFRYRGALLDITVQGSGDRVTSFTLDGKPAPAIVPATLTGEHRIAIQLGHTNGAAIPVNLVQASAAPDTPVTIVVDDTLHWEPVQGAIGYRVYRNAVLQRESAALNFFMTGTGYAEYQISAVSATGVASFLSEPVVFGATALRFPVAAATDTPPFIELHRAGVTGLRVPVRVPKGMYAVTFEYSNGAGPVNTNNRCAIRTLFVDGRNAGPVVMPQRGTDAWDNYGTSSRQVVKLDSGEHTVELRLLPADENMNGEENRARIRSVTFMPLGIAAP